jgi:heterodisulfide reductase subunit A-like polyferredoxin
MMYEKKGRYIVEFPDIPTARQHLFEIGVEERRGSYKEVELGFDEERALKEAKRCLSCRRCLGCALCWAECKPEAINFEMEDEVFELEADEVIISPGVERPTNRIDKRFGFGWHLNVVTDLQLERMLSESGPSAGLIIRPFDGEVPASVAFVQSYASASPEMHRAALCYGINEAILVRKKLDGARIAVFATGLDSFMADNKEAGKYLNDVELRDASVSAVDGAENEGLKLTLGANGSETTENFELVVLITQPQISKDVKDLGKSLGLSLDYASFLAEGGGGPLATDRNLVSLALQA